MGYFVDYLWPQVDSLQYATLATVSRCGMVWFSAAENMGTDSSTSGNPGTVTTDMLLRHKVGMRELKCRPCMPLSLDDVLTTSEKVCFREKAVFGYCSASSKCIR